mmetsp:Transcript_32713/g.98917  ORF Transcript_32713/g.98917 Transcript_32713/m.98917 type:complete len:332 (-) Transcript_32713:107-1102(-)
MRVLQADGGKRCLGEVRRQADVCIVIRLHIVIVVQILRVATADMARRHDACGHIGNDAVQGADAPLNRLVGAARKQRLIDLNLPAPRFGQRIDAALNEHGEVARQLLLRESVRGHVVLVCDRADDRHRPRKRVLDRTPVGALCLCQLPLLDDHTRRVTASVVAASHGGRSGRSDPALALVVVAGNAHIRAALMAAPPHGSDHGREPSLVCVDRLAGGFVLTRAALRSRQILEADTLDAPAKVMDVVLATHFAVSRNVDSEICLFVEHLLRGAEQSLLAIHCGDRLCFRIEEVSDNALVAAALVIGLFRRGEPIWDQILAIAWLRIRADHGC